MRNIIVELIQIVALSMVVLGIIGLFIFKLVGVVQCIEAIFGAILVYGFSYIVDAACKYLNRCEYEEYSKTIKKTEV